MITISQSASRHPFDRHYLACVGSGHAALALRTDYAEQLKRVHSELGIKRVRFHGVFDEDMKVMLSLKNFLPLPGTEQYYDVSFTQIGLAYDTILKAGMKPWVELSFMPDMLAAKNAHIRFSYHANISYPKDYAKWEEFLGAFIRFLFDRYGKEEVESWYFEVWNEPNLGGFFAGKQKDYFELYRHTANALKRIDQKLMVGGPATATNDWVDAFVSFCETNSVPVDFVSTHQYMGEPLGHDPGGMKGIVASVLRGRKKLRETGGGSVLDGIRLMFDDSSESRTFSKTLFADNVKAVKKQAKGLPVFYTEWNGSSLCGAPHNDTRKLAANALKNIMDMEGNLTGSSIWAFSDIFEETFMFPQEFSGNFGLLTLHNIRKPVYHAFEMLKQVGDTRIDLSLEEDDIECAAFENEEGIQVLLYRPDLKCRELPPKSITLVVEGVCPKKVTVQKIDETHCNPLKLWEDMGKPKDLKPSIAKEIDDATSLLEEEQAFVCKDGDMCITAALCSNDCHLIKIYR